MADDRKKQLTNRRITLLAAMGRARNFLDSFVAERDAPQVPIRIENLDTVWMGLEEVQSQLEEFDVNNEGMALNTQIRSSYESKYFQIKAALQSYLPQLPSFTHAIPHSNISGLSGIKLPTISLPEFDGDYNQWLAFHDTFVALIHSNADVPDIQKFHYLRAAVKGEAAQVIESIAISSANYTIAWQTLESRYANEYLLKKRHLQALLDCPRMKKESASALHNVVDEFERHTKTLRQLGEPVDSWSTILEHLLCLRLDDATLKSWEDYASTVQRPDYKCLIEFLQRRIRVLESMSVNHQSLASHSSAAAVPIPRNPPFQRFATHASTEHPQRKCNACEEYHQLFQCPRFEQMPLSDRLSIVNTQRLCYNCFNPNHIARNCASKYSCRHCRKRHHTTLHPGFRPSESSHTASEAFLTTSAHTTDSQYLPDAAPFTSTNTATVQTYNSIPRSNSNVLLSTVVLMVVDAYGKAHPARAILDNGSQSNIMSERLCQLLHLRRNKVKIPVYGVGQSSSNVKHTVHTNIGSRKNNFQINLDFLVMPRITIDLPAVTFPIIDWHLPQDLFLADPNFNKSGVVDMLIGAEHFFNIINTGTRFELNSNITLIKSVFGWIVTGRNQISLTPQPATCHLALTDTLQNAIERFWAVEEIQNRPNYSIEEQHCESHYEANVSRTSAGRYIVQLPRHPNFDDLLGESKANALRRFQFLEKRLSREPDLKHQYHAFLSEYLALGHMRLVQENEPEPRQAFYLPHHPVIKDTSTTTKVRVVFDGSAKTTTGFSLNDALHVGPIVQDELLTLVLRFRKYPIALVADIEKMYRQVLVQPRDIPLQRIFWRFQPEDPVSTYELLTVTYGLSPSAFLATRTLKQLAKDEGEAYPLGGPALGKGFYVDDFIGGAQTVEEAVQTRIELDELLAKGGFSLRKWSSNNLEVLRGLDPSKIGTQSILQFEPNEAIKALGVGWEPQTDQLRFNSISMTAHGPPTKRSILSGISKHFDPLGLTAPVVVRAKIILQELWLQPCGWDEEVPDNIRLKWEKYSSELSKISTYRVNRCVLLPNSNVELHTFADASEQAYGACTYARSINPDGSVNVQLIASKSRVAPLKRVSLPRLELSAAVLAARLHSKIVNAFDMPISASFFWSDSLVTLEWLRSPPNTWKTFIANRVSEIQDTTQGSQWNHVAGVQNPADLVTRGMTVDDFMCSELWHFGPPWLRFPAEEWPETRQSHGSSDDILERRTMVAAVQTKSDTNPIFTKYSSYIRLLRVTAYCLRFIAACCRKSSLEPEMESKELTVDELTAARQRLVRLAQADRFGEEINCVRRGQPVSKHSHVRLLSPIIDSEGIIRVGGRLNLSEQPYQTKHPILLPRSHPFTHLLARYYHFNLKHGGGRVTLANIRQEFWPIDGKRIVNNIIRKCFRCARASPVPAKQQMGQLPAPRVTPSRPFSATGVDYAGPVYLKPVHKRAAPTKAYICIFVCLSTKAVHIELVSDLTTPAFLAALRRFVSTYGCPGHIYSDNGKNFQGARNELHELYRLLEAERKTGEIATYCANQNMQWHMIPPRAPHFGGLWEAAVKVAKKHLYRQLGNSMLNYEDMSTVLKQIAACMNSRPLTPMTENPNDLAILTPGHFLIGASFAALPDADVTQISVNRLEHYQQLQRRVQQFWHEWKTEYLQELQKVNRRIVPNTDIKPGRMVVVVDEFLAPVKWPLARITAVHPGKDGLVRVVSLRTAKGPITRPITKICLLPYEEELVAESPVNHQFNSQ